MRTIVSTIGTSPYRTSQYFVDIIQCTLHKNKHAEAATWETTEEEIQASCDVTNLYPSISIDNAITVLLGTFNNDLDDLNTCTKLKLTDIHKLTNSA